jgi:hypothetical protein
MCAERLLEAREPPVERASTMKEEVVSGTVLDAIRHVSGPATLVAYLAALAAWAYVAPALAKLKAASRDLLAIPPEQRRSGLEVLYGPIPKAISAEQWIRNRRMRLVLVGFVALLVAGVMTIVWSTKP